MNLFVALGSLFSVWWLVLMIPGPNFVVVSQLAISDSRRAGILGALGTSFGAATWAAGILIGLRTVFLASTIWYSLMALLFSITEVQTAYSHFRKILDKLVGGVLMILGIRLVLSP